MTPQKAVNRFCFSPLRPRAVKPVAQLERQQSLALAWKGALEANADHEPALSDSKIPDRSKYWTELGKRSVALLESKRKWCFKMFIPVGCDCYQSILRAIAIAINQPLTRLPAIAIKQHC